jgi:hypothetical protein
MDSSDSESDASGWTHDTTSCSSEFDNLRSSVSSGLGSGLGSGFSALGVGGGGGLQRTESWRTQADPLDFGGDAVGHNKFGERDHPAFSAAE